MGKHLPTTITASYLTLMQEGKVLLVRRANSGFYDGYYSLPAGHVEIGETFTQALIREMSEEIGIRLQPEHVRVVHIMHRKADTDGSERVDTFYTTETWEGDVKNLEPEKCDDLAWFPMTELPENTIPYIRVALENIERGVFYSEYGW